METRRGEKPWGGADVSISFAMESGAGRKGREWRSAFLCSRRDASGKVHAMPDRPGGRECHSGDVALGNQVVSRDEACRLERAAGCVGRGNPYVLLAVKQKQSNCSNFGFSLVLQARIRVGQ